MAVMAREANEGVRSSTGRSGAIHRRASNAPIRLGTAAAITALTVGAVCIALIAGAPIASVVAVVALLPAATVDLVERRLPNRLVAIAAAAAIVAVLVERQVGDRLADLTWTEPTVGAALFAGPLLVIHLTSPAAMGFGDVKAAAVLGAAVGLAAPASAIIALALASGLAAATAIVMRRSEIAFGPFLVVGSAFALATGPGILA